MSLKINRVPRLKTILMHCVGVTGSIFVNHMYTWLFIFFLMNKKDSSLPYIDGPDAFK